MQQLMEEAVRWIIELLTTSNHSALDGIAERLVSTPFVDFSAGWFLLLWDNYFALGLTVLMMILVLQILRFGFSRQRSIEDVVMLAHPLRFFGLGTGMLVAVAIGMQFLHVISLAIFAIVTDGRPDDEWITPLQILIQPGDLPLALAIRGYGWIMQMVLQFQVYATHYGAYMFAIWVMLTYSFHDTKLGKWLGRFFWAALVASLVSKLFQLVWLGLGSTILYNLPGLPTVPALILTIFFSSWAVFLPVLVFIGMVVRAVLVERSEVDVRSGNIDAKVESQEMRVKIEREAHDAYVLSITPPITGTNGDGIADNQDQLFRTLLKAELAATALERGGDALAKRLAAAGRPELAGAVKIGTKAGARTAASRVNSRSKKRAKPR